MYQVVKRDGKIADFDISKISVAITKAFEATQKEFNQDIIDFLALKVTADYQDKIHDSRVTVEDIQDSVESVLGKAGYEDVAKAYILYRKQREKVRNVKSTMLDYKDAGGRLREDQRLAGEGELHCHLLCGRPDPLQLRRHHRQLLAQRGL